MKIRFLLTLFFLSFLSVNAQNNGSVLGKVLDNTTKKQFLMPMLTLKRRQNHNWWDYYRKWKFPY